MTVAESVAAGAEVFGAELRRVTFRGCKLDSVNFRGAALTEVTFDGCELRDVDFAGATLTRTAFPGSRLARTDFTGVTMDETDLRGAELGIIIGPNSLRGATSAPRSSSTWLRCSPRPWASPFRTTSRGMPTPAVSPACPVASVSDTGLMRYLSNGTTKKISKIGLGTWQFGSREWGYGDAYAQQEARAITRRALELGVTLFDTAEIYGFGRSERILGQALGEDAATVFVATKILPVLPVAPVVEQRGVASANRLGVRRLDLYQVHQPNPVVRDGTIMRGMRALQQSGWSARSGSATTRSTGGARPKRRWAAGCSAIRSATASSPARRSAA